MKAKRLLPMQELGALRIKALAREIGADSGYARGWIAEAASLLGLPYTTLYGIIQYNNSVGLRVIDKVCTKVGCTPQDLLGKDNGRRQR